MSSKMFHVILLGFLPEEYSHVHYTDIIFVYSQYCYCKCNKRTCLIFCHYETHLSDTIPFRDCTRVD